MIPSIPLPHPRPATAAILAALLSLAAQAQAAKDSWKGRADIGFSGTSTLHSWAGKVKAEPFTATVTTDDAGRPEQLDARVEVKASGMNTEEEGRDKNMRKAMRAGDFPLITGVMDASFAQINDASGLQPARLPFSLELLGRKHEVTGKISRWQAAGGEASFDLDFELSLKECGITVPSVLLFVRVGDTIKVHATVKLQRSND